MHKFIIAMDRKSGMRDRLPEVAPGVQAASRAANRAANRAASPAPSIPAPTGRDCPVFAEERLGETADTFRPQQGRARRFMIRRERIADRPTFRDHQCRKLTSAGPSAAAARHRQPIKEKRP